MTVILVTHSREAAAIAVVLLLISLTMLVLIIFAAAAVSGYYFSHPGSQYFVVGRVSKEQAADYAQRKGVSR